MLEVRAARHGDAPALDALGAAPEAGVFVLEKNGGWMTLSCRSCRRESI